MSKEELIEAMVTQVMEDFDFEKVQRVMGVLGWKWQIGDGEMTVPSNYRLMREADRLLRKVAQYYGEKEFSFAGSGGFMASLEGGSLSLQFILTETTTDHRDFIDVDEDE